MRLNTSTMRHGVSLVEALVALAIMAFGMLALVGVQSTLRMNSDLSKQRGEATRIATEEIELLRRFKGVAVVAGQPVDDYFDGIVTRTVAAYASPDGITNTSYRVERTVRLVAGTPQKVVSVQVSWDDRTGVRQTVTMDSVISGADPTLSALLMVPLALSPANQRSGRHASIPAEAIGVSGVESTFRPFSRGTVVWVFNNLTGLITSRCTDAAPYPCPPLAVPGRLLAGFVQFDLRTPLPSSAAASPAGPALPLVVNTPLSFSTVGFSPVGQSQEAECIANPPFSRDDTRREVQYYCLVFPTSVSPFGWGGKLNVNLANAYADGGSLPGGSTPENYKICRYTTASTDFTVNANHPKSYCMEKSGTATSDKPCTGNRVTSNLSNQNFLVIAATQSCPLDTSGGAVNYNTQPHPQP